MAVSRSLGMEPLVETANAQEMSIALRVGAKVLIYPLIHNACPLNSKLT